MTPRAQVTLAASRTERETGDIGVKQRSVASTGRKLCGDEVSALGRLAKPFDPGELQCLN
jgi:hypothetical protein